MRSWILGRAVPSTLHTGTHSFEGNFQAHWLVKPSWMWWGFGDTSWGIRQGLTPHQFHTRIKLNQKSKITKSLLEWKLLSLIGWSQGPIFQSWQNTKIQKTSFPKWKEKNLLWFSVKPNCKHNLHKDLCNWKRMTVSPLTHRSLTLVNPFLIVASFLLRTVNFKFLKH